MCLTCERGGVPVGGEAEKRYHSIPRTLAPFSGPSEPQLFPPLRTKDSNLSLRIDLLLGRNVEEMRNS